ncbi:MAG TPA: endo-1,4-beta-xylanase [Rhizomicrobium sp.]|jgi:endo-1,4-beta-xylanase
MQPISRRDFVAAGTAIAASGIPFGASAEPADSGSLDALARAKGLRFGSAMNYRELSDAKFCDLMRTQGGVMVTENELKWPVVQSGPDTFTFATGDALAKFAADNNLLLRGHNLLWQKTKWMPDWVNAFDFGPNQRASAEALLRKHITTEMQHYSQVVSWDVVNETIDTETGAIRDTVFTRAIGPEVIDFAYQVARETAPRAQLVYNDYMSWETYSASHRDGVLRFLEGLKKRNVPVDALGLQSHIGANNNLASKEFGTPQETAWRHFLDDVTGMGYALLITEFDVNDDGLPDDIAVRDEAVADYARRYLDVTLSYKQVGHVLTWGLVDSHSWLQSRFPRPSGAPKRPLPYDANYQPKPLREAIAAAFRSAPAR